MLESYPGADGMKTGYTEASGHNLVTSAVRGGVRLIGVVLGARSNAERDIHMASLLDQGFSALDVPPEHRSIRVANRLGLIGVAQAAEVHPVAGKGRRDIKDTKDIKDIKDTKDPKAGHVIQVGAFRSKKAARHAADAARRVTETGDVKIEPVAARHRPTAWRVQLIGLTRTEAQGTCAALSHHHVPCRLIRPDARQMASR
jgi:D-alanyl-D-alanine carboxypeptidase